ncbi:AraC family transcriptional regulator [Thalassotalea sp. LPB0316]|uniref:AraC family transcriptional regulator n=1 Tax=Thalassotalea sp. LPB0316 TaxID=2769490 RepID=UPI0018685F9F|nr:AraC family transcriptional regulator [Thalassotalea sp. LPB0316]QOL26339.1 AraC family transcriptional regulator [Thalassotalea sp. LPB0316]
MSSYFSVLSGWMIPITRVLEEWQIDLADVLKDCDVKSEDFKDQESRLSAEKMALIIDYCNRKKGRKDFALAIAKAFHPGMFHALGYAMMSSESLKDALYRIARYKRVVSNTCTLNVEERGENIHFVMDIKCYEDSQRPVLTQDCIIAFLGTIVQFARETLKTDYNPLEIHFNWPKPNYDTSFLNDYFKCDIVFDSDELSLVFDEKTLSKQLVGGNPLLTQSHEKILDDYLSRLDKNDVEQLVKNRIYEMLPLGTPSQTEIASQLGMSLRNLQRRLQEKQTSFRDILENTRKKLALEYILQSHLSFSEIGYLVGFSNIGNFNRAFKRWTGVTPGVYRKQQHNIIMESTEPRSTL